MRLLGFQIQLVLLLQLVMTAIVITAYAVSSSMQEAKASHLNYCHMILLISFVKDHHPKIKSLSELAEAGQKCLDDGSNDIHWLSKYLDHYQETGELPKPGTFHESKLLENLLILITAPVFAPLLTATYLSEMSQYRYQRITHTEMRKAVLSKVIMFLFSNMFILLIALLLLIPKISWLGYIIFAVASFAIATCILHILVFAWGQMSWKDFWQVKLLDLMALASKEGNHDLFNRAMIFRGYLESQPDIPIPGNLGLYAVIYSGVQGIILLTSKVASM